MEEINIEKGKLLRPPVWRRSAGEIGFAASFATDHLNATSNKVKFVREGKKLLARFEYNNGTGEAEQADVRKKIFTVAGEVVLAVLGGHQRGFFLG